jgi:hypothetical protein
MVAVGVTPATGVSPGCVVGSADWAEQEEGAIPPSAVNRQQVIIPREKTNSPTAITNPTPTQINWLMLGRFNILILSRKLDFFSTISLYGR